MAAIGLGARREIDEQFAKMGVNLIIINSGKQDNSIPRTPEASRVMTLKLKDVRAIEEQCSDVEQVMPSVDGSLKVKYKGVSSTTLVFGVTANFQEVNNFQVSYGRFFSDTENNLSKRVVVLGEEVRKNLFSFDDPVGERIRIDNIPFEVVGVLSSKGLSPDGANLDNKVLIPVKTAQRRVFNISHLNQIYVKVRNAEDMYGTEKVIEQLLRERHRLDILNKANDFTISNQLRAIETQKETTKMFNLLITGVAGISLIVGGVGVLAVMLLSIKDRTGEIGLRLSVGARKKDIVWQFLSESIILGLSGGMFGIALGVIISGLVDIFTDWQTSISLISVLVSGIFSMLIGLIFGVIPATRASNLDPINALQKE